MYSINAFTSDGTKSAYTFSFAGRYPGYISKDHVKVYYDDVQQDVGTWKFIDNAKILLDPVPASGVIIKIARETPITNLVVQYSSGAVLSEHNLDKGATQFLFLIQEMLDKPLDTLDDTSLGLFMTESGDAIAKAHDQHTDKGTTELQFQLDINNDGPALTNSDGDMILTTDVEKTLELDTYVWDDLRITPGSFDRPGSSDPGYFLWEPGGSGGGIEILKFNQGDYATFTIQLPHSYAEGEDIEVHMHWTPGSNGVTEAGTSVYWRLDYSWANINEAFGPAQTAVLTDSCPGADDAHLMTPSVTLDGTGKKISSMLVCKVYRDTGDTWAGTLGDAPGLLEVDFHTPMNTIGSRQRSSK